MIITLTGSNRFAWQHELTSIIESFRHKHDAMGLERLDGEEASLDQMREAITSLPFLVPKKLVVLRAPSANKQFAEKAESLLADVPETTDVVLVEPKLDKRLAYYKFLKKQTDFRECSDLDASGLAQWLVQAAKQRGGKLNSADSRYLVERVGPNQQLLASELDKLLLYSDEISRQTIDLLTDPTPQSTIFQLLEAAFAGNAKRMIALYAEQRALKVEPPQIIAMLAWQLHVLALVKTAGDRSPEQIAKSAKLSPFVVRKSQGIARNITLVRLKELVAELLSIDTRSKRTALDADEALQLYLLKLAK